MKTKTIAKIVAAMAILTGFLFILLNIPSTDATPIVADTSWYNDSESEFVLTDGADFLGFAALSKENAFAGKTIKLGADIVLNPNWVATESPEAPDNPFAMIGKGTTVKFAGTFDGQGHTISGIYVSSTSAYSGLFMTTDTTAVVKNFRLTNSYFTINANNFFGSIVGATYGSTIENVYSDAILRTSAVASATNTQFVGGIVGGARGTVGSTIRSCEFAGDLSILTGNFHGGIMGYTMDGTASTTTTISNCLFTGKVASAGTGGVGGILGRHNGGTTIITHSVALGTVETTASGNVGEIAGYNSSGTLTIEDSNYAVATNAKAASQANCGKTFGSTASGQTTTNKCVTVKADDLKNSLPLTSAPELDYENKWSLVSNNYLTLKPFADVFADVSWYDANETTYEIGTKEEFYGLVVLSKNITFTGKTILLTNDIVYNEGDAFDWSTEPAKHFFPMIGLYTNVKFDGTFDGQGHTVSGLYTVRVGDNTAMFTALGPNAVIKNFYLKNSYFSTANNFLASIAGASFGATIENVYSDAIVESTATSAAYGLAGFVGQTHAADTTANNMGSEAQTVIKGCWFNGELIANSGMQYTGGFIGRTMYGSSDTPHLIKDSLYTGYIHTIGNGTGGFVGSLQGSNLLIDNCLCIGSIYCDGGGATGGYTGLFVGSVQDKMVLTLDHSYASREDAWRDYDGDNGGPGQVTGLWGIKVGTGAAGYTNSSVVATHESLFGSNPLNNAKGFSLTNWSPRRDNYPLPTYFGENDIDISWYDANETTYEIGTAAELNGLSFLSPITNFSGKTILLTDDIEYNEGDASEWSYTTPEHSFYPIGLSTNLFSGTFDGQGHTISGIYINETSLEGVGLFIGIGKAGVVKNFSLVNSYITSEQNFLGAIAGKLYGGRLEKVYSDAYVTMGANKNYTGGLVGVITHQSANAVISNCMYAGTVTVVTGANYVGGIAGGAQVGNHDYFHTIEHCFMTGTVDGSVVTGGVGGLLGYAITADMVIRDSFVTGVIYSGNANNYGFAVGRVASGYTITLQNAYALTTSAENGRDVGLKTGATIVGQGVFHDASQILGLNAYINMNLDFKATPYWIAIDNKLPELKSFSKETPMDLSGIIRADTSWYDASKSEFTITTMEELLGFTELAKTTNFANKTIKLGADITLNTGNSATWKDTAPAYTWTQIAINGLNRNFAGTFDGQGHTISGLYLKVTSEAPSASQSSVGMFGVVAKAGTVKNFRLVNSYFESCGSRFGSVVGTLAGGTVDSVYSDAIVYSTAGNASGIGGIVGGTSTADSSISNVWFAGNITSQGTTKHVGGILGDSNGAGLTVTIDNALFTGSVSATQNGVGGILGATATGNAVLKHCFSNPTSIVSTVGGESAGYTGIVVGMNGDSGETALTLVSCYGISGNVYRGNVYSVTTISGSNKNGTKKENFSRVVTIEEATGAHAFENFILDFSKKPYWVAIEGNAPELATFTKKSPMALNGYFPADDSFYDADADSYTIATENQFVALALMSKTDDFAGKEIYITKNLTFNTGDAKTYGDIAPKFTWPMIGSSSKPFAGTLDGGNCIISGLYLNTTANYTSLIARANNATIQNINIRNSYFASTKDQLSSVVGRFENGLMYRVSSDAIVVGHGSVVLGGLIGGITLLDSQVTVSECMFTGSVSADATPNTGGQSLGGVVGSIANRSALTIKNTLVDGTISSVLTDVGEFLGGFVGRVTAHAEYGNCIVNIEKSLTTAKINANNRTNIGSVIGLINGEVNFKNVYATNEAAPVTYKQTSAFVHGLVSSADRSRYIGSLAAGFTGAFDYLTIWDLQDGGFPCPKVFADAGKVLEPNFYDVIVYSRLIGGGNVSVAPIIGGGVVAENESYTVTAGKVSNLRFVGWFLTTDNGNTWGKTSLNNNYNETNYSYTGIAKEDVSLVAVYETGSSGVSFEVLGTKFEYSINGAEWKQVERRMGGESGSIGNKIRVRFTDPNHEFLAWVNASGKVVSRDPEYAFTLLSPTSIYAEYGNATDDSAVVMFLSGSNQVIKNITATETDTIDFPTPYDRLGMEFDKWDKTEAEIQAEIAGGSKQVIVRALYKDDASKTYRIDIQKMISTSLNDPTDPAYLTNFGSPISGENKALSELTSIAVPESESSNPFVCYMRKENDKYVVVSYERNIVYRGTKNETIYAVYSSSIVSILKPMIAITSADLMSTSGDRNSYSFATTYNIPENCEVAEQGFLFLLSSDLTGKGYNDTLESASLHLSKEDISRIYISSGSAKNGATVLNIKNVPTGEKLYIRGYLISRNADGTQNTIYTGVAYADGTTLHLPTDGTRDQGTYDPNLKKNDRLFEEFPLPTGLDITISDIKSTGSYGAFYEVTGLTAAEFTTYKATIENAGFVKTFADEAPVTGSKYMVAVYRKDNRIFTLRYQDTKNSKVTEVLASFITNEVGYVLSDCFRGLNNVGGLGVISTNAYATGDGTYTTKVADKQLSDYNTYVAALMQNGFTRISTGSVGHTDVYATTLVRGRQYVVVTYLKNTEVLYVSAGLDINISEHLTDKDSYRANLIPDKKTTLTMLDLQNDTLGDNDFNGNSFVIQLKNGHFIVLDGGYSANAEGLITYLESLAPENTIPVIEAWIITHPHGDHVGAFTTIAQNSTLSGRIRVNGIYYSGLSNELLAFSATSRNYQGVIEFIAGQTMKDEFNIPTRYYRLTTGQRYYFCDIVMEVLLSQEEIERSAQNGDLNDTSTILGFLIENQTFVTPGDAGAVNLDRIVEMYSADVFDCDIYQASHHGYNYTTNFMNVINPGTVLLSSQGEWCIQKTADMYGGASWVVNWNTLKGKATEWASYGQGNVVITFPYAGGSCHNE